MGEVGGRGGGGGGGGGGNPRVALPLYETLLGICVSHFVNEGKYSLI